MSLPTSPVILAVAHPDDETLMAGVMAAEHFAAGADVHLLGITDGEASGVLDSLNGVDINPWWGVRHDPAREGYAPLSAAQMATARVRETVNAMRTLAAGHSGTLTFHYAHLPDGGVTQSAAQAAILAVADQIAPGAAVRLKGHTDIVDDHPDHLAVGRAIRALQNGTPSRFSDCRYYVNNLHWTDSRLSQVSESWDLPTDSTIADQVINACRSFACWAPAQGMYAVGMHSESSMFDTIIATPKCMLHT